MIETSASWLLYTKDLDVANQYRIVDETPVFSKNEAWKKILEQQTRYINFYDSYQDSKGNYTYLLPWIAYNLPPLKLLPHNIDWLYDYQEEAYNKAKQFTTKWLLIVSGTWTGKSYMMKALYNWLDKQAIFLTFKTSVKENIEDYIWKDKCYCLPTFKKECDNINNWQALIIDECHSMSNRLRQYLCRRKWRIFWFTATPFRSDYERNGFKIVFWSIHDTNQTALPVKFAQIKYNCNWKLEDATRAVEDLSAQSDHKRTDLLYKNPQRHEFVVNMCKRLFMKSKRIIVFTSRIYYRDLLYSTLLEIYWPEKVYLLNKKINKQELDRINSLDEYIIVANEQYAWEWVDIPTLVAWLLTFNTKNVRKIDQMAWRVRRRSGDKTHWRFVDIGDIIRIDWYKPRYTHYNKRKSIYLQLWFHEW